MNLDLPARERWSFLVDYKEEVNELLQCYLSDFVGAEDLFEGVGAIKETVVSSEYLEEIECIASISDYTADQVLLANLYYDFLKLYLGCTAFAVETPQGNFHARNLDWWTDNNLLSSHSRIFLFQRAGKTVFKTVGWLGFIGALSGIKPNGFSITLNAVSSNDSAELAMPVSFLLRDVLEKCNSLGEAQSVLEQTKIASDCLLLLTGTKADEMVVIERTPTRSATRTSKNNRIAVTNDYKLIDNNFSEESELQSTSCGRYERAESLLSSNLPTTFEEYFEILRDQSVMMGITVQQMVFEVGTGEVRLIKTGEA